MENAWVAAHAEISGLEEVITEGSEMTQSQETDYLSEEDDDEDECNCEVCQAARAEAEGTDEAGEQLAIDRVSDTEWKICDFQETDHPLTYVLYVNAVQGKSYENTSFTLVECDCDNFNNEFEEYQVFTREIWSAPMYIGNSQQLEKTAEAICDLLPNLTISNPIELAYFFGGQVHNRNVKMPPVPDTN